MRRIADTEPRIPSSSEASDVVEDALAWGEYWENQASNLDYNLNEANKEITRLQDRIKDLEAENGK